MISTLLFLVLFAAWDVYAAAPVPQFIGCVNEPTSGSTFYAGTGSIDQQDCPGHCMTVQGQLYAFYGNNLCYCSNTSPSVTIDFSSGFGTSGSYQCFTSFWAYITDTTFSTPTCYTSVSNPTFPQPVSTVEQCFQKCQNFGVAFYTPTASGLTCGCVPDSGGLVAGSTTPCSASTYYVFTHTTGTYVNDGYGPAVPSQYVKRQMQERLRKRMVNALCPSPASACTVGASRVSYECIDTDWELESCGGCVNGYFSGQQDRQGVDCTKLPGVHPWSVTCLKGQCRAFACAPGWSLSVNGTCV